MPIRSIMPCTVPSSPGTPWRALNTTSGAASASRSATCRSMSIRVTRWLRDSSASATPLPLISETGRSLAQPPISTATWRRGRRVTRSSPFGGGGPCEAWWRGPRQAEPPQSALRAASSPTGGASSNAPSPPADPLDFPFESHALALAHPPAHFLAQSLDIRARRIAGVYQEVGVLRADLRAAQPEPAATGRIDQAPGLVAGRILEGRAAGLAAERLRLLAGVGDAVHLRADVLGIARD